MEGIGLTPKHPFDPIRVPFLLGESDVEFSSDLPTLIQAFETENRLTALERRETLTEGEEYELSRIVQKYLFFHVLSAFLGAPIWATDLVQHGYILTNLPSFDHYYPAWHNRVSKLRWTTRTSLHQSILEVLDFACDRCDCIENWASKRLCGSGVFPTVILSIRLLLCSLDEWRSGMFLDMDGPWISTLESCREALCASPLTSSWRKSFVFYLRLSLYMHLAGLCLLLSRLLEIASLLIFRHSRRELKDTIEMAHRHRIPNLHTPMRPGERTSRPSTSLLLQKLEKLDWCPLTAQRYCQSLSYTKINYLSLLSSTSTDTLSSRHDLCAQNHQCVAYNITPDTAYNVKHVQTCSYCPMVCVSIEELARILGKGNYPIISVDTRSTPWKIEVVPYKRGMKYIFFSHVWSDGLGNPYGNGIPNCQLHRLVKLAQKIAEPNTFQGNFLRFGKRYIGRSSSAAVSIPRDGCVYFWLDTLCVPRAESSTETVFIHETRKKAIKLITPVVVNAVATFVLDTYLDKISCENLDDLPAYLMTSKWIQRIWTLEEGCMAQVCIFVIGDKLYQGSNPDFMAQSLAGFDGFSQLDHPFQAFLEQTLQHSKRERIFYGNPVLDHQHRLKDFIDLWNGLLMRSGSRSADAIIVFASLMDFQISSVLLLEKSERLSALIRSCRVIPFSLLYNNGPRLGRARNRQDSWLPVDIAGDDLTPGPFLQCGEGRLLTLDYSMTIPGTFFVYVISKSMFPAGCLQTFILRDDGQDSQYVIQSEYATLDSNPSTAESEELQLLCYILDFASTHSNSRGSIARGVQCQVVSQHPKLILQYSCPLLIWTIEQWEQRATELDMPSGTDLKLIHAHREPENGPISFENDSTRWPGPVEPRLVDLGWLENMFLRYTVMSSGALLACTLLGIAETFMALVVGDLVSGDVYRALLGLVGLVAIISLNMFVLRPHLWLKKRDVERWCQSFFDPNEQEEQYAPRVRTGGRVARIFRRLMRRPMTRALEAENLPMEDNLAVYDHDPSTHDVQLTTSPNQEQI